MDNFLPNIYQKSIYTIDYAKLKKSGIKCLIFGLNNTISPIKIKVPTKKMKNLFEDLKDMGFKIIIMSNSRKSRVEPFKNLLNVDAAYLSFKPLKKKYLRVLKLYHFKENQIACIGDKLLSDIFGANRMNMTSILVNSTSSVDYTSSKIMRVFEILITNKFAKDDKLKRGQYYE